MEQSTAMQGCPEREFDENGVNDAPGNFAESVAVEKEERSRAMKLEEEIQGIAERQLSGTVLFPSLADSLISFRVMSVESFSSIARSSVEAGDKLPVPVFDKSGSAL